MQEKRSYFQVQCATEHTRYSSNAFKNHLAWLKVQSKYYKADITMNCHDDRLPLGYQKKKKKKTTNQTRTCDPSVAWDEDYYTWHLCSLHGNILVTYMQLFLCWQSGGHVMHHPIPQVHSESDRNQAWLYSPLLGALGVSAPCHPGCNSSFQRYLGHHRQQLIAHPCTVYVYANTNTWIRLFNIKTAKAFELRETPP